MILQLQRPADAVLSVLDHLGPGTRVIMDGVPEDEPARDPVLAAAGLTVGHPGGRSHLTATRVTALADATAGGLA